MKFTGNHLDFIQEFAEAVDHDNAAIFAGAGLSVGAGYVDWKGLLTDIAKSLSLDIEKQEDLIALAQYHYNEHNGRTRLNKKILNFFTQETEQTVNHKILSRLPISTYWTTNYDNLLEESLSHAQRIVDVKHQVNQLSNSKFKRDAVVYKMHGDASHAHDAIITRDDYEKYFRTHEPFVTALQGDLTTKTFLFIGFSFSDPNLDYVLSRIRLNFKDNANAHYCILKRAARSDYKSDADYEFFKRKQELQINDLKNYQITTLLIDNYPEITQLLQAVENRYKRKSIFISGSAHEYGGWGEERAQKLVHNLTKELIKKKFRVVNGFGLGIGSAVINGGMGVIYSNPQKYSANQLITRPFPQFMSDDTKRTNAWKDYRERMISLTGVAIFVFGNKKIKGKVVQAEGVRKEFEIAIAQGCIPIPIGATGYVAKQLWLEVKENFSSYYSSKEILPLLDELNDEQQASKIIRTTIKIIDLLV